MVSRGHWRFVAAIAILAMLVALLSGGLSGIQLNALVLRSVFGGIVFAIIALVIKGLMLRFYPEFFRTQEEQKGSDDTAAPVGARVNIVSAPEEHGDGMIFGQMDEDAEDSLLAGGIKSHAGPAAEDLNSFSEGFGAIDSEAERPQKDDLVDSREPEEVAKAIHTVITRDEKG